MSERLEKHGDDDEELLPRCKALRRRMQKHCLPPPIIWP